MSAILRDIQIGPCRLILGDALDVLPRLAGVADLVVTDPPYRLTSGGNSGACMSGIFSADQYDNGGELMDVVRWSQIGGPIYRALKADADAYVMANDKNLFAAHAGFTGTGFKFHNLLGWDKGAPTRNLWYMKHVEPVLYLWKGKARTIRNAGSKQIFACPRPKGAIHPTQKPVELLTHYITNSSAAGDTVLDPFAGSGATLLAAAQAGRKSIGIEVSEEHFQAAAERLSHELKEPISGPLQAEGV